MDLDGTLVKSDTLLDSVIVLARQSPGSLLRFPTWILQGKAAFKHNVSSFVALDVVQLPYNQPLLQYLRQQHAVGREIYLATGADHLLAERVAAHLGLFTGVLASDGTLNLTGHNKLAAFQQRFPAGFSYIGNARPDLPLLTHSVHPMVANPSRGLRAALHSAAVQPTRAFTDKAPPMKAWLCAIRLHQWAKNTLVSFHFYWPTYAQQAQPSHLFLLFSASAWLPPQPTSSTICWTSKPTDTTHASAAVPSLQATSPRLRGQSLSSSSLPRPWRLPCCCPTF